MGVVFPCFSSLLADIPVVGQHLMIPIDETHPVCVAMWSALLKKHSLFGREHHAVKVTCIWLGMIGCKLVCRFE